MHMHLAPLTQISSGFQSRCRTGTRAMPPACTRSYTAYGAHR